ncbi:hypothetical protein V6N11_049316 [Hibiscus sabdariffa]|uniref:Uncharacterized protein n=2 Tax=Hibiscus sabdariffa TaxID=183260 RepID=A0ABR2P033_9ROSI
MDSLLPQGPFTTCLQCLNDYMSVLQRDHFTFLIVLLWNIWNRRNRWVHSNQLTPMRLVSEYAQMVMADFQEANEDIIQRVPRERSQ